MPTIKDVAQAAGVSTATVSYVLNGTKPVGKEVAQRVWDAAHRLQYRPNASARNLRKAESRIIGYELPIPLDGDMAQFMHEFTYHLTLAAAEAGYNLMTFATTGHDRALDVYRQLILTQRVDAFVVSNTTWDDPRIHLLIDSPVPFVAFGRANAERQFAYVDVDGYDGMRQVAEHLVEQGHQRIGFIGWPEGSLSGDARYQGITETLARHGLAIAPHHERRIENCAHTAGETALALMEAPDPPTAIICVSDMIALGAMRRLARAGWRIGPDVAITGFDDIPLADYLTPALTTVHQPLDLIGRRLIEILLHFVRDSALPASNYQMLLTPSLVIRESSVAHSAPDS